ncbi:hypothetical protein [Endozoicomonas sp. 8E]|uniref:hypothetical protein n=1 Tax=Endozoicomonas sp. 8E TaxID=3035692 RepID=UPI002938D73C|nr:hypothetical protein [Endozoicomonas sp. 8E]WOG28143.1 hypothetical protein P6910_00385 [Endozoicomonas sp. 8E]
MKSNLTIVKTAIAIAISLSSYAYGSGNHSQNTTQTTTLAPTPVSESQQTLASVFPKYTTVFGIKVRGTEKVPDEKLLHAAKIMAEYLDNNDDGRIDNQQVVDMLVQHKATLAMIADDSELQPVRDKVGNRKKLSNLQDLKASETHPNGAARGVFDGALEEVLHLITHLGYSKVYPEALAERHGSLIADAMDKARGGRFDTIPDSYPKNAWFTYEDESCNYSCMITEYTYFALTSMLGGQQFPGRLEKIQNEWKLNTRDKVRSGDPDVYNILTNPAYLLPSVLPDGQYNSTPFEIKIGADESTEVSTEAHDSATKAEQTLVVLFVAVMIVFGKVMLY